MVILCFKPLARETCQNTIFGINQAFFWESKKYIFISNLVDYFKGFSAVKVILSIDGYDKKSF